MLTDSVDLQTIFHIHRSKRRDDFDIVYKRYQGLLSFRDGEKFILNLEGADETWPHTTYIIKKRVGDGRISFHDGSRDIICRHYDLFPIKKE